MKHSGKHKMLITASNNFFDKKKDNCHSHHYLWYSPAFSSHCHISDYDKICKLLKMQMQSCDIQHNQTST